MSKFIEKSERNKAAIYFTLSNLNLLDIKPGENSLDMLYNYAEDTMVLETGASIKPEFLDAKKSINEGSEYYFEEWEKVKSNYR